MSGAQAASAHFTPSFGRGIALACLTILIWGAFLPVSKTVLAKIDPYFLNAGRFAIGALVFLAVAVRTEGWQVLRPRDPASGKSLWPMAILFGIVGHFGYSHLVYQGAPLTRAEVGSALLALTPVWLAFYQWSTGISRPTVSVVLAIACVVLGEWLVVTQGDLSRLASGAMLGNLLILISGLCWAFYTIGGQRMGGKGQSALAFTAQTTLAGTAALIGACIAAYAMGKATPPSMADVQAVFWPLVFLVVFVTCISFLTWSMAVRHLGPLNAGLFAPFAPVITFLIALSLGQQFVLLEIVGAAMVIGALVLYNVMQRRAA
ncbi:MAG: DMT family transporter [Burkholderiaceae bacterium]